MKNGEPCNSLPLSLFRLDWSMAYRINIEIANIFKDVCKI